MDTLEHLIQLTQRFDTKGWTPATSSNFSLRIHCAKTQADQVLITRSGCHKGMLTHADFMRLDVTGKPIDAGKPSAETGLHLMLYQHCAAISAVLHTHSPQVTVSSMLAKKPLIEFANYEILKAFPGCTTHETSLILNVYPNDQDISRLVKRIALDIATLQIPAFLIEGHGLYAWGDSLVDAARHLEAVEFLLHCEHLRSQRS